MTNKQVGENFLNGKYGRSLNMESVGGKLYSYNTVIAQWVDGEIIFNKTKYSITTSKQTNWLKEYASLFTSKKAPFEVDDLRHYI